MRVPELVAVLRVALALSACAMCTASCECVAGLDEDVALGAGGGSSSTTVSSTGAGGEGASSPASAGSGGAGQAGGAGGSVDCSSLDVPGYPGVDDAGGDVTVVVAVRAIDLNDDDGPTAGLNLDGVCTCPGASSCIPHPDTDEDNLCDSERGIDAQSQTLFGQLSLLTNGAFASQQLSQDADAGEWTLLLRIEGWTGEPTDSKVRFSLFTSQAFGGGVTPQWNGTDAWQVDRESVGSAGTVDDPRFFDDNAYIADGVLVASLPASGIVVVSEDARLKLAFVAGFLKARLVEAPTGWALREGVLSARLPTSAIFDSLDDFRDGNGDPLCTDNAIFGIARDTVCESADIFSGTGTPTSPCDSISLGVGFDADPAMLGQVVDLSGQTPGCPEGTEPSRCDCSSSDC